MHIIDDVYNVYNIFYEKDRQNNKEGNPYVFRYRIFNIKW